MPAADHGELLAVLRDARDLLTRPENDFGWSSWRNAREALEEIDTLTNRVRTGEVPRAELRVVFAPTGPLQEVSISSGWAAELLELASRMDDLLG